MTTDMHADFDPLLALHEKPVAAAVHETAGREGGALKRWLDPGNIRRVGPTGRVESLGKKGNRTVYVLDPKPGEEELPLWVGCMTDGGKVSATGKVIAGRLHGVVLFAKVKGGEVLAVYRQRPKATLYRAVDPNDPVFMGGLRHTAEDLERMGASPEDLCGVLEHRDPKDKRARFLKYEKPDPNVTPFFAHHFVFRGQTEHDARDTFVRQVVCANHVDKLNDRVSVSQILPERVAELLADGRAFPVTEVR